MNRICDLKGSICYFHVNSSVATGISALSTRHAEVVRETECSSREKPTGYVSWTLIPKRLKVEMTQLLLLGCISVVRVCITLD